MYHSLYTTHNGAKWWKRGRFDDNTLKCKNQFGNIKNLHPFNFYWTENVEE